MFFWVRGFLIACSKFFEEFLADFAFFFFVSAFVDAVDELFFQEFVH